MSANDAKIVLIYPENMCTIYARKTQIFILSPTGTDLVRGDAVVVLGAGGLGGHATTTSAGRAARQLNLAAGQRRSDQLSWPGTRVLACVLTRMRLQTRTRVPGQLSWSDRRCPPTKSSCLAARPALVVVA